jgi:hypothetical protein
MLINLQFSGSVLRKGGVLLFIQKFATFSIKSFLDCLDALHYIEDGYVVLSLFFVLEFRRHRSCLVLNEVYRIGHVSHSLTPVHSNSKHTNDSTLQAI